MNQEPPLRNVEAARILMEIALEKCDKLGVGVRVDRQTGYVVGIRKEFLSYGKPLKEDTRTFRPGKHHD